MLEANEKIQLASLTERDIRIACPGDIGTADFQRCRKHFHRGGGRAGGGGSPGGARFARGRVHGVAPEITTHQSSVGTVASVRIEGLAA